MHEHARQKRKKDFNYTKLKKKQNACAIDWLKNGFFKSIFFMSMSFDLNIYGKKR